MKIISIKFQNLNSLKGIHDIRFDRPPFNESNLFAITGPTGAGKTTILDAITIALYGRVHRHGVREAYESMTKHTTESFSEVEFEINNDRYRARWSAERDKRGKSTIGMELCSYDGTIIADRPLSLVQKSIVDVCGLDYTQFLRSVMLSQGDFTRFMKASESERSELLEKLTDTAIYSQISAFVYEKNKIENNKLNLLTAQLDGARFLSESEITSYQLQLDECIRKEKLLAKQLTEHNNHLQWLNEVAKLEKKKGELEAEHTNIINNYQQNKGVFDRWQRHKEALVFKPALTALENNAKVIDDITEKIKSAEQQIVTIKKILDITSANDIVSKQAFANAEAQQKEVLPKIVETERLDIAIGAKVEQLKHIQTNAQVALETLQKLSNEQKSKTSLLGKLSHENEQLKQWLEAHRHEEQLVQPEPYIAQLEEAETHQANFINESGLLQQQLSKAHKEKEALLKRQQELHDQMENGEKVLRHLQTQLDHISTTETLEKLEAEAAYLPDVIVLYERQLELVRQIAQIRLAQNEYQQKGRDIQAQIAKETVQIERLKFEYGQAKDYLAALQEGVRVQLLIQKYEDDRKSLQSGQECPLCGSKHHPFVENSNDIRISDIEQKRNQQQITADTLLQQFNAAQGTLQHLQSQSDDVHQYWGKTTEDLQKMLNAFDESNQRLPESLDINNQNIESDILKTIAGQKEKRQELNVKILAIRQLEKQQREQEVLMQQVKQATIEANSALQLVQNTIDNIEKVLVKSKNDLEQWQNRAKSLNETINRMLENHQLAFIYEKRHEVIKTLKNRHQVYIENQNQWQQNRIDFHKTQAELESIGQSLSGQTELLTQLSTEIAFYQQALSQLNNDRQLLLGSNDPKVERQRLEELLLVTQQNYQQSHAELEKQQKSLDIEQSLYRQLIADKENWQKKSEQAQTKLLHDLQSAGIPSMDALQLMSDDEASHIETLQQNYEKQKTTLERMLRETNAELSAIVTQNLTSLPSDVLVANIEHLTTEVAGIQQEIGRITEIISADKQRHIEMQELAKEIELQHSEVLRWEKLSALIGSADGKKFRKYAQSITLRQLIKLANGHIKNLTDRYIIQQIADSELDFEIVDHYQADAVRPMSTLSGGESFLVSLSLALGLSEMASRKTQINSLFIDEGFGMLDAETLDVAVSALEDLQLNGKTIGVISHVETLKERIGTQIQVEKRQGGHSRIKVMAYGKEY